MPRFTPLDGTAAAGGPGASASRASRPRCGAPRMGMLPRSRHGLHLKGDFGEIHLHPGCLVEVVGEDVERDVRDRPEYTRGMAAPCLSSFQVYRSVVLLDAAHFDCDSQERNAWLAAEVHGRERGRVKSTTGHPRTGRTELVWGVWKEETLRRLSASRSSRQVTPATSAALDCESRPFPRTPRVATQGSNQPTSTAAGRPPLFPHGRTAHRRQGRAEARP